MDHGLVQHDLSQVAGMIRGGLNWSFRMDPESDQTMTVRFGETPLPAVARLLAAAIDQKLAPGYVNRIVLSRVPAGKEILPHTDDFGEEVRSKSTHYHLPIQTDPAAIMGFAETGEEVHLERGHLYGMDETVVHYVKNPSSVDRVHLLFAHFPHRTTH